MESGTIKLAEKKHYLFLAMYEFLGMIIFLVGINCSNNSSSVRALSLFIAATLTGRVCGGHFNMAVTFGVYLVEAKWRQNLFVALLVIVVDIVGAFLAMGIAILLLGPDNVFLLVPPSKTNSAG